MADVELKTDIELVELDTLEPYANNPKEHPDDQVDKIARSIERRAVDLPEVIS